MASSKDLEFHEQLQTFVKELETFRQKLSNIMTPREEIEPLRGNLKRSAPRFKGRVIELTGQQYGKQLGRTFDIWTEALSRDIYNSFISWSNRWALDTLIDCVNEALGILESGEVPTTFEAFKAVDNFIKNKTGLSTYGKDLMAKVFNEDNPLIKLNELRTKTNRDEQEGFKFLFMGAMEGIRNPNAHDEIVELDPFKTLEYLGLASLLMRKAEEGKLTKGKE
jgi:uncharacterized protein (TIGR02391 family)